MPAEGDSSRVQPRASGDAVSQQRLVPTAVPTVAASAAATIRAAIFDGRYAPGERLVESELSQQLGVSRGPIRESLAVLEREGIVVGVQRRGKFVVSFTPESLDEIYSFRTVLDCAVSEILIENMNDEVAGSLTNAVREIGEAVGISDVRDVAAKDIALHDLMYELSGHELLRRAWQEGVLGKLKVLLNLTTASLDSLQEAEIQHRLLIEPLIGRDIVEARRRVVEHVEDAHSRALNLTT